MKIVYLHRKKWGKNNFNTWTWIAIILFLFISTPKGSGLNQRMKAQQVLLEYTTSQIAEHEETFDENNLRDFVDVYIQAEKQNGESKGKGLLLKHWNNDWL